MHVNFSFLSRKPSTVYAELEDLDGVSYCIPCRRQISTKMTMWHSMSSVHKTEVAVYIRPSRNQASFILQRYQMCISQCRNEISMLLAQRETGTERVYKKAEPYPRRSASALPSKEKPPKKKQSMHVPECHICNQVFAEHRSFFEHFTQQPHIRKLKPHLPSVSKASAKEFTGITTIQGIQNRLSFG
ncbi:hypothetical protein NECID01_0162 [Nematocida sp. AWRm77]|nr:hypothetical protein NECID01_0162 [Nematocida sp. AWRm77]